MRQDLLLATDASCIANVDFPLKITRTQRKKTASIKVEAGRVQVIIPHALSHEKLQQLLAKKALWIQQKIQLQAEYQPIRSKTYVSGESFAYLGKHYRLKLIADSSDSVKLKNGYFVLGVAGCGSIEAQEDSIKTQLQQWYCSHASERLEEKTHRYAKSMGLTVKQITVKSYKSRWGSCSADGNISYNWKIIMAPHLIVDYVVVHELSHILHYNHSPDFWKCVARYLPDYKDRREWLKVNHQWFWV